MCRSFYKLRVQSQRETVCTQAKWVAANWSLNVCVCMLMQMLCMCVDLVVLLFAASHCARMQHTTQWITYTFFACWNGASKASHFNYYSRGFYFWTAAVISPQHSRVWFHNSSLLMKFAHYFLSFLLIFLSTLMRTLRHGQIFCWFNLIWFGCFFVCLCVCDLKQVLLYRFFFAIRPFEPWNLCFEIMTNE